VKLAKDHAASGGSFFRFFGMVVVLLLGGMLAQGTAVPVQASPLLQTDGFSQLAAQAEADGTVRVLVQLDLPFRPEGELDGITAVRSQQLGIDGLQESVLDGLAETNTAVIAAYKYIPYLALEAGRRGPGNPGHAAPGGSHRGRCGGAAFAEQQRARHWRQPGVGGRVHRRRPGRGHSGHRR
jgi:hypothetical protein